MESKNTVSRRCALAVFLPLSQGLDSRKSSVGSTLVPVLVYSVRGFSFAFFILAFIDGLGVRFLGLLRPFRSFFFPFFLSTHDDFLPLGVNVFTLFSLFYAPLLLLYEQYKPIMLASTSIEVSIPQFAIFLLSGSMI